MLGRVGTNVFIEHRSQAERGTHETNAPTKGTMEGRVNNLHLRGGNKCPNLFGKEQALRFGVKNRCEGRVGETGVSDGKIAEELGFQRTKSAGVMKGQSVNAGTGQAGNDTE